jgi:hypothetical protein
VLFVCITQVASDSDDTRLPGDGGQPATETQLSEVASIAEQAGKNIAERFRNLTPQQRRTVVTQFRCQLFPPGKPGRKRSKEITAAYADWAKGMRGVALYQKHLPRFDRMGHWERKVKTRALLDAIRTRKRREQDG